MSHQFNYYLTPADMAECEARVRKACELVILRARSPSMRPSFVPSFVAKTETLTLYLVRPSDVGELELRPVRGQSYFLPDEQRAPIVELERCFYDGATLRRGRMYFTSSYFDASGAKVAKSDDFVRWAKRVFSAAKKGLIYGEIPPFYLGREALDLHRRGVCKLPLN